MFLPRKKLTRVLFYFTCFCIVFLLIKLLFPHKEGPGLTEVPKLVAQKGNERYLGHGNFSVLVQDSRPPGNKADNVVLENKFGKLNVHIWEEICGESLGSLRNHVLFPKLPSRRLYAKNTAFSHSRKNSDFGQRIFGFLHPKQSGAYAFRVRGSVFEVWISKDSNRSSSVLLLYSPISATLLKSGVFELSLQPNQEYYIEILHKQGQLTSVFDLQWKPPGSKHYTVLSGQDISLFYEDKHLAKGQIDLDLPIVEITGIHKKDPFPTYDSIEVPRANLHRLPLLDDAFIDTILPMCDYKPSYLVDIVLSGYLGVWETHYNSLYPIDKSNLTRHGWTSLGNDELPKRKALQVVEQFMNALNKGHRKFMMKRILSVEENHDMNKGDRYLLELELQEIKNGLVSEISARLSRYVYRQKGSKELCYPQNPQNYQWRRNATVNIVLTVGGSQGKWVQHFINNLAEIYRETKDVNLNVVIMDFHCNDIDIKRSLEESGLPRYMLLRMESKFHKTMGLQYAMKFVSDPNDIVFVCDLHLYLPVTIIDHIRKHCIQGKTVFSPLLARLDCGDTPNNPYGRWESDGYGPLATFKSDWDRFGGMNVEKFRNKWGGEDWEIVDRILSSGYEIERLKLLNFVHFYHTKKGMWHEAG